MVIFLVMRERLTGRSPWSPSVTTILFIIRREVGNGGRSPSPFAAQLPLQMINLLLHGFGILFMREVATTPRMAFTGVGSMHTSLLVSFPFQVDKMILPLGPPRFCLVWTWTYHSWKSNSLSLQDFLRMAFTGVGSIHTSLSALSPFKVDKMILPLGPPRFCLVWTWTYYSWKSNSLSLQDFPQTAPIVRTRFSYQAQQTNGLRPNKPKIMNL